MAKAKRPRLGEVWWVPIYGYIEVLRVTRRFVIGHCGSVPLDVFNVNGKRLNDKRGRRTRCPGNSYTRRAARQAAVHKGKR